MSHTHDYFSGRTVDAQTGRASTLLVGTLIGGVLALSSYPAGWLYGDPFYRDIVAAIAAILLGLPIVLEAFNSLRRGHTGMDRLAAIAICAAFAKEYYQVAAVVSFFFHLSNLIEKRTALGARASVESLIRLTPKIAHLLLDDGSEQEVQTSELRPGNVIRVRPGDNVPADGEIIGGESTVSQASITGESLPVDKAQGDEVFSGTVNLTGSMDIRVTRAGADDDYIGRLRDALQSAFADPRLADARDTLLLTGMQVLGNGAYQRIDDMENAARASGYAEIH